MCLKSTCLEVQYITFDNVRQEQFENIFKRGYKGENSFNSTICTFLAQKKSAPFAGMPIFEG
jgi:hypothetical protein